MKKNGKIRQIVNHKGELEWSQYPASLEEALREDVAKYLPPTFCPEHNERSVIFVLSGLPGCCIHHNATAAYNEAVVKGEPTSILKGNQLGVDYYWSPKAHDLCGHPGKTLFSGKCFFCREARDNSPRQVALKNGETWYMPLSTDPCSNGHVALRRVNNGACKQCEDELKVTRTNSQGAELTPVQDQPINKVCPDLIISRKDAEALGYKVYRTGKSCKMGHIGWRYISTCGCLDCLNQ